MEDILKATEATLQMILHHPDPNVNERLRIPRTAELQWLLEDGHEFPIEEVGKAASLILAALLEETDQDTLRELLITLLIALEYNDIHTYLNFDDLVELTLTRFDRVPTLGN